MLRPIRRIADHSKSIRLLNVALAGIHTILQRVSLAVYSLVLLEVRNGPRDISFISHKEGKIATSYLNVQLKTFSEARSAVEAATVCLERPVPSHTVSVSEGGVDRQNEREKTLWDLQEWIG